MTDKHFASSVKLYLSTKLKLACTVASNWCMNIVSIWSSVDKTHFYDDIVWDYETLNIKTKSQHFLLGLEPTQKERNAVKMATNVIVKPGLDYSTMNKDCLPDFL